MSNPFEHRQAASEKTFTGREDELRFIHSSFEQTLEGHASHLMVYGDRGLGKTSLLNHVQNEYKKQNILFVPTFLGGCRDMGELMAAFVDNFSTALKDQRGQSLSRSLVKGIKGIFSKLKGVKIGTDGVSLSLQGKPSAQRAQGQFASIIAELWGEIASEFAALCICFDETEILSPEMDGPTSFVGKVASRIRRVVRATLRRRSFISSFSHALRSTIETLAGRNLGKVKFVVSCVPHIKEKLCASHPSLPRSFELVKLTEFPTKSIRDLLQKGLALDGGQKSATPEFEQILAAYSDGIPYHVQLICHYAYDTDSDNVLDASDFQQALLKKYGVLDGLNSKYYEDAFRRVSSLWRKAGDCLRKMAEAGGQIGLDALVEKLGLERAAISTGVAKLRIHGFVAETEQRGQYQLSNKLCHAWICKFLLDGEVPLTV